MKNILSILLVFVAFAAKGQIQEYVIEASDSLITRGVLQINADKFKATTQVSSDDTTLVSLDYLTNLLDAAEYADSLAFHSGTGYLVYYRAGVALDSTSLDGRYQTTLTNPVTGTGTTNYIPKFTGLSTLGNSRIIDNNGSTSINTTPDGLSELLINSDQGNINNAALKLWYNGSNSVLGEVSMLAYRNSAWNGLYINGSGTVLTNSMYVDGTKPLIFNAGNVAIKQTSASYPLDVNGEIRSQSLIMAGTYQTAGNSIGSDNGDVYIESGGAGKKVVIRPEGHSATSGQVKIEQSGVDIPGRLTVGGIKLDNYIAEPQTIGYIGGSIYIQSASNGNIYMRPSGTTNTGIVNIGSSGMSVGGDVPTQSLDVYGNARFRSIGTTTTSTILGVTSDGTLTTNVSITGGATWKGGWNASTNTPTLSDATGTNGWWYKVTTAGTQNLGSGSITFAVGDDVIHNGTVWQKFSAMISEADPVFVASDSYHWTTQDSIDWNAAYGWGDHSIEGYITAEVDGSVSNELQNLSLGTVTTTTQPINISSGTGITLPAATTSTAGLMSAADKIKINSVTSFSSSSINYIPKWTSLLGDLSATSLIYDNGTNVGIGKTSMNEKLDVNGNISVDAIVLNNYAGKNNTINRYGTDLYFEASPSGNMYFRPNGTGSNTGIVNISTGGMSVGGTAPTQTLDVNGNGRFRSIGTGAGTSLLGITSDGTLTTNVSGLTGNWNTAYNDRIASAAFSGTTTKTLTLTQQDGGTVTANFTDNDTYASTATGNLTEAITGLEFSAARQVIGGATELRLTTGYGIPTTTQIGNIHASGSDNQTLTVGGTTSPTISLSGSNTATFSGGTGITLGQSGGTITVTNSAPDQTVSLTGSGATSVTGTYPNFTISSTDNNTTSLPVKNSAGTTQFTANQSTGVRFTGSGATTVSYTPASQLVTISSTDNNTTYTGGNGLVLNGNAFDLGLQELTTTTPSLNTHWIPWVNSANNLHYRVGLLDLQNIAGYNAGKIQNVTVSSTAPTTDYVLKYNGSTWSPAPDATGTNYWTQASGALYPATITDEVRIGSTTDNGTYKLQVTGDTWLNGLTNMTGKVYASGITNTGPVAHTIYYNPDTDEVTYGKSLNRTMSFTLTGYATSKYVLYGLDHLNGTMKKLAYSANLSFDKHSFIYNGDIYCIGANRKSIWKVNLTTYAVSEVTTTDYSGSITSMYSENGYIYLTLSRDSNGIPTYVYTISTNTNTFYGYLFIGEKNPIVEIKAGLNCIIAVSISSEIFGTPKWSSKTTKGTAWNRFLDLNDQQYPPGLTVSYLNNVSGVDNFLIFRQNGFSRIASVSTASSACTATLTADNSFIDGYVPQSGDDIFTKMSSMSNVRFPISSSVSWFNGTSNIDGGLYLSNITNTTGYVHARVTDQSATAMNLKVVDQLNNQYVYIFAHGGGVISYSSVGYNDILTMKEIYLLNSDNVVVERVVDNLTFIHLN